MSKFDLTFPRRAQLHPEYSIRGLKLMLEEEYLWCWGELALSRGAVNDVEEGLCSLIAGSLLLCRWIEAREPRDLDCEEHMQQDTYRMILPNCFPHFPGPYWTL